MHVRKITEIGKRMKRGEGRGVDVKGERTADASGSTENENGVSEMKNECNRTNERKPLCNL